MIVLLSGFITCSTDKPTETEEPEDPDKAVAEAEARTQEAEAKAEEKAQETAEAEKQAEEHARQAEEARKTGDAAKAQQAEEEQRKAEAEAARLAEQQAKFAAASEKARQIAVAVQNAAAAVKRAEDAKEEVSTSLNILESEAEGFTTGEPFSTWKEQVRQTVLTAKKALRATVAAEDITTAFNKAEEANTAANQGMQVANKTTNFVIRFQERFIFYLNTKKLYLYSQREATPGQKQRCRDLLNELNREFSRHTESGYACAQDGECVCRYVFPQEGGHNFLEKK